MRRSINIHLACCIDGFRISAPMTTLGTDNNGGKDSGGESDKEEAGESSQTNVEIDKVQVFDDEHSWDDFYVDGSDVPGPSNSSETLQQNDKAIVCSSIPMDDTPPSPCKTITAPDDPDLEDRGIRRSRRKRKARSMGNLSQCLCGLTLSQVEVADSVDVIQCKRTGCETGWVSSLFCTHIAWFT